MIIWCGDNFVGEDFSGGIFATLANTKPHTASRTHRTATPVDFAKEKVATSLNTEFSGEIIPA